MNSILSQYHDCDRVALVIAVAAVYAVIALATCISERRRRFAAYEQRRRRYSEWRMNEVRNGRM